MLGWGEFHPKVANRSAIGDIGLECSLANCLGVQGSSPGQHILEENHSCNVARCGVSERLVPEHLLGLADVRAFVLDVVPILREVLHEGVVLAEVFQYEIAHFADAPELLAPDVIDPSLDEVYVFKVIGTTELVP